MKPRHPVLLLEADADPRRSLGKQIAADGMFIAVEADSVGEADAMVSAPGARFEALILGLVLPDGDGCDLCASLRQRGLGMPILLLADSWREADLMRGFASGANDYVAKPVRPRELLARLRAHLRGFESSKDAALTIGPYVFRPSAKLLHEPVKNRRVWLSDKETGILKTLYRSRGKPVSRRSLLDEVWGYNAAVTTHTLETHIYRLRQRIEPDPANPRLLVTAGGGYYLNAIPTLPAHEAEDVAAKPEELERLEVLEAENARLRRAVAELTRGERTRVDAGV